MERITIDNLYQFVFVSDAVFAPDGKHIAYLRHQADGEGNCYHTELWLMDANGENNFLLAKRGEAKDFLWIDHETLLFASNRASKKEGKKLVTEYYAISIFGGEATLFMSIPLKVEQLLSAGENRYYVQAAVYAEPKDETSESTIAQAGTDYEIFDELPFWFNGKGIRNCIRTALFLYDRAEKKLERLTSPFLNISAWAVSPGGSHIAYSGNDYCQSICPSKSALWLQDILGGTVRQLVDDTHYHIDDLCFMGEDTLFYAGTPKERMGQNPRCYCYAISSDTIRELPFLDLSIGNKVGSDAKYGGGKQMVFSDEALYLLHTVWGNTRLATMDKNGRFRMIVDREGVITGIDLHDKQIVMTAMRDNGLAEVYLVDQDTGRETQLTDCNHAYLSTHQIQTPERFTYRSNNGFDIEGFVLAPAEIKADGKYPGILVIHGGPKGAFGSVFFHEMQCMAAEGFFVFYTNPRGSDGRGEAFADLTEAFGTKDYIDIMEFTDEVLRRYPQIDPERLGVGGGSYGGFMTNWIIGQTDRFASAVSQRSISNYLSKVMYTDIGYTMNRLQLGAYPWEDFDKVWKMSPLCYAHRVKTPTLFLQSDEDYRCWMGDALQMFSAVKRNGTPARFVLFHGESHELSRSGKPHNRVTRLKEMMDWYRKYLKIS